MKPAPEGNRSVNFLCQREYSDAHGVGSHPWSIMAAFQQFLSCLFLQSSLRGGADYRLVEAPANTTQHNTILPTGKVLPFLFSADWFIRTFFKLWEEVKQKELVHCMKFFSQGTADSKQKVMYKAGQKLFTWKDPIYKYSLPSTHMQKMCPGISFTFSPSLCILVLTADESKGYMRWQYKHKGSDMEEDCTGVNCVTSDVGH